MINKGYEDYLRHKSDNQINNLPVMIMEHNKFVQKKWIDIKVKIQKNI